MIAYPSEDWNLDGLEDVNDWVKGIRAVGFKDATKAIAVRLRTLSARLEDLSVIVADDDDLDEGAVGAFEPPAPARIMQSAVSTGFVENDPIVSGEFSPSFALLLTDVALTVRALRA